MHATAELPDLPLLHPDIGAMAAAIEAAGQRFAAGLLAAPDPSARAGRLEWSVQQLGVHLAFGCAEYTAMLTGGPTLLTDLSTRTAVGAEIIAREAGTPIPELADRVRAGAAEFAAALRAAGAGAPVPFYATTLPAEIVGGLFLAEALVHGDDLGRLPIPPEDAALAGGTVTAVLPSIVKPGAPRRATLAFRIRGHGEVVAEIDQDRAWLREPGGRIDVRLSAEPVTFLLACYQRVSPLKAMLGGRLSVVGRRPWRLKALQTRFESP